MSTMGKETESHSIPISEGQDAEHILYRLKRGSKLSVHPDASLLGRKIVLYTNYPAEGQKFVRTEYRVLGWQLSNGKQITSVMHPEAHVVDTDIRSQVELNMSGTYHFYFRYLERFETILFRIDFALALMCVNIFRPDTGCSGADGALYVQVEPTLHVGPPGAQKTIPLDSVRCQTVLAKLLGPLDTWEPKLRVAKEAGYNVIHFTPIQELGGSRSCYSLRDQLKVNSHFAPQKGGKISFEDVEKVIKKCRQEWGVRI